MNIVNALATGQVSKLAPFFEHHRSPAQQLLWREDRSAEGAETHLLRHNTLAILCDGSVIGGLIVAQIDHWNRNVMVYLETLPPDEIDIVGVGQAIRSFFSTQLRAHKVFWPSSNNSPEYAFRLGATVDGTYQGRGTDFWILSMLMHTTGGED